MAAAAREPTVTDADVVLGRIDPATFSGGKMALDVAGAKRAAAERIASPLTLSAEHAALGISEIVDENMANAARVHAIESGKDLRARTMIAFGGAAPLHAARVAEKLGIGRVLVPANAGVGSAVGLLARAGRLRGRARPPDASLRLRCRGGQPPVRRDARRGGSDRAARRAGCCARRTALGVHALSRARP